MTAAAFIPLYRALPRYDRHGQRYNIHAYVHLYRPLRTHCVLVVMLVLIGSTDVTDCSDGSLRARVHGALVGYRSLYGIFWRSSEE